MPITVITVMVINNYRNRIEIEKKSIIENAEKEMILADRLILNKFNSIERELNRIYIGSDLSEYELREITRKEKLLKHLFIIDKENKFLFPPETGELSKRETEFLEEAGKIELITSLQSKLLITEKNETISDWYTWFMGDRINFIYFNNYDYELKEYLIEKYALISELINVLPDSGDSDFSKRIQLFDARGDLLYQWGNYNPEKDQPVVAEKALSAPLGSWRFYYYYKDDKNDSDILNLQNYMIILGMISLTFLILFLAYYFYKENSRAMNIAGQKVSFVNQVSHELKTPLTNIRLYSELLQSKLKEEKELEYIEIIINEGCRLSRLINNVLIFNKGEKGNLTKRIEKTDINKLINQVLEKFRPLLNENDMETIFRAEELPFINTDADMVEQIISNIVSNAVKYGSSGKYLRIDADVKNDYISIRIADRGPGIALKERKNIFKPFYRINNSLSEGVSGTGIGLSIAQTLAMETGAELKIEDTEQGAAFILSLPSDRR